MGDSKGYIDSNWYLSHYTDVGQSGMDPAAHYIAYGRKEGRFPNRSAWIEARLGDEEFDPEWYLNYYPDVASAGWNAVEHYIGPGRGEKRFPTYAAWAAAQPAPDAANLIVQAPLSGAETPSQPASGGDAPPALKPIPIEAQVRFPLGPDFLKKLTNINQSCPKVSIVILSYMRPDLVENLLNSIFVFTTGYEFEIIVVNNGSPHGKHVIGDVYRNYISEIDLRKNRYIGDAYNIGVEKCRGEYVILMNNDIVVQPGWMEALIQPLEEDHTIGATGPKFLYPNGLLQEAGALIDATGNSIQLGKRNKADAAEFCELREVDYCTGATIAIRRRHYIELLGYSWFWAPGYFEDADLCFLLRERGLKTIYTPEAVVYHLESFTMSETPPVARMADVVGANRLKFVKRWSSMLKEGPKQLKSVDAEQNLGTFCNAINIDTAEGRKFGFFLPYEIFPGGGEKYLLSLAKEFSALGRVFLITDGDESVLRMISVMKELAIGKFDFCHVTYERARSIHFDKFFLLGNEIFPQIPALGEISYYICQFPFDTPHEVLSKRYDNGNHLTYQSYLAYSEYTKKHISIRASMWGYKPVIHVINPTIEVVGLGEVKKQDWVLGVGRFFAGGHNKRHDKMIEAFSYLEKHGHLNRSEGEISCHLQLAGAAYTDQIHRDYLQELRDMAVGKAVSFNLNLTREELSTLYQKSKVYWHAAGWGVDEKHQPEKAEHFGLSLLEAMSAGCVPVVIAIGGPQELIKHGINGFLVGSTHELAEWTARILNQWEQPTMKKIRDQAFETALRYDNSTLRGRMEAVIGSH
ncbi:glycosyltransferase [Methylobacterium sp. OT2]|uniref:glycosyltransferase n=1 Tax=Methylobacterium sp. OT2 TaxID=2813779 RepID=UPI00197BF034|nr:glycosyltransferase [Methylobacterium sp. OT2]MBN4094699.1 glycosyltransferase [Methylobacterium sp. OT2]